VNELANGVVCVNFLTMSAPTTLVVAAPFDRRTLETLPFTQPGAVEAFLATAQDLHRHRRRLPKWERIAILERAAGLLDERREAFALRIAQEGGKPLMDARVEVIRAADGLRWSAHVLANETGRTVPLDLTPATAGRSAVTVHEPIGPVVAISAFNHPLNLIVHQVGPAIAAGCPVIVKPALATPLSCLALVALLREAGLPEAWCQVAIVEDAIAETLATDPRVAFLSFIGSAKVGWSLRSKLAPGTRCALEHGGAAPVIIEADADLEASVPLLVKGGYYHAGQVCVSVQRIFVHRDRMEELAERLTAAVARLRTGDPEQEETEVGPLIRPAEVRRVSAWVEEAQNTGATVLCGGAALGETLYVPTVLRDAPPTARVLREEIFGPVTVLQPFETWEQAVAAANDVPWAFQAAVFTADAIRARQIADALDASAVMVNDHTAFRADWMPFGGRRSSGLGVGGIPYTFADLRPEKLIVTKG